MVIPDLPLRTDAPRGSDASTLVNTSKKQGAEHANMTMMPWST
jgi:hypothetical protein